MKSDWSSNSDAVQPFPIRFKWIALMMGGAI
jgi:hypothetical protein